MQMDFMQQICSDEVLEQDFAWLCRRRRHYAHNDDVWALRFHWPRCKRRLQADLRAGRYRFTSLRRVHRDDGDLEIWSAFDSLVLKAIAIVLGQHWAPQLSACHLAGNGGAKAAVRKVAKSLSTNNFVFRTDVKSYYASIQHEVLFRQLADRIDDPKLLSLLWQYMRRTVYDGGIYEDIQKGISLGCPLSPLMGALFLDELDQRMQKMGLCYVRFMDDWVVLAPTRWKLRRVVRVVNQILDDLQVEQHPDKTFVGRIERGFTFLGYHINAAGLIGVARPTMQRFVERVSRLYEQGAEDRIGDYVRRWLIWVKSGVEFSNACSQRSIQRMTTLAT